MLFRPLLQFAQIGRLLSRGHFPPRSTNNLVQKNRHKECLNYTGRKVLTLSKPYWQMLSSCLYGFSSCGGSLICFTIIHWSSSVPASCIPTSGSCWYAGSLSASSSVTSLNPFFFSRSIASGRIVLL